MLNKIILWNFNKIYTVFKYKILKIFCYVGNTIINIMANRQRILSLKYLDLVRYHWMTMKHNFKEKW